MAATSQGDGAFAPLLLQLERWLEEVHVQACFPKGTPTLEEVADLISDDSNMPEIRKRDLISSLKRVEGWSQAPQMASTN